MERKTCKVLGYDVDLFSFKEAVSFTCSRLDFSQSTQVVTINPEMIELADKNKEFSAILTNAELVIPDGAGIEFALKLKGISQERIPGIDFSKKIIEYCVQKNFPIALIGAKEEVIQKTVENLKKEFPNINISYSRNGYFDSSKIDEIYAELNNIQPKLILVALGAPKQEMFISECKKQLKSAVFIGVGGSFDVWAGVVERAPKFFQKLRCEWLYRTLKQPERFKRIYKTLPLFVIKAIIDRKE